MNHEESQEPGHWSRTEKAVAIIWLTLAIVLCFPVYGLANRVDPILLGLPMSLWWIAAWILLATIVLFVLYRREYRKGAR